MLEDLQIVWWTSIWDTLEASFTRNWWNWYTFEYQRYCDWIAINWWNQKTYKVLRAWEYVVAVLTIDSLWDEWEIQYSDWYQIDEIEKQEPIAKEYIVKLYDKNFVFVKVVSSSIIVNDITYSENIDEWQWQLVLNLNLPLDTNYLDNIKYVKVFVNDDSWLNNYLIYAWYLSKFTRLFSNDKENIQATFLSVFALLNEIYFKQNDETEFTISWTPWNLIKQIIDYVDTFYSWIFSYTEESIDVSWNSIDVEVNDTKCWDLIKRIVEWTNHHLFVWADGVVHYQTTPSTISHYFTYWKDVSALTIPEDYEQIVNAVRIQYWYLWWPHSWITTRAENTESIAKFGRKEQTIVNENIYGETSANQYRDEYLAKYSKWKLNISITINSHYQIETIHPWDTIKVRNLWIDISWLQISSVSYNYDKAVLKLEYQSNIAKEIFNS